MRALASAASLAVVLLNAPAGCGSPPAPAPYRPTQHEEWTAICLRRMERVKLEEPDLARAQISGADGQVKLWMPLDTCGESINAHVVRSSPAARSEHPWLRSGEGAMAGWVRQQGRSVGSIHGYYALYLRDAEPVEGVLKRAIDDCLAVAAQTTNL